MALQKIKLHFIKSRAKERFLKISCKVKKSPELTLSSLIAYFHWAPWPPDASRPVSRHCQPNSPPPHRANSEASSEKSWILLQNLFFFKFSCWGPIMLLKQKKVLTKEKYGNGSRSCSLDLCIMIDSDWTHITEPSVSFPNNDAGFKEFF